MSLSAGDVFAGYTVVRPLGSGGMGEVYLVKHPRLPRHDALKVLPVAAAADPEYRTRFEREADLAAALWHPHVVGVHDRGEYDGRLWIAMDYVAGHDAAALLRDSCRLGMPPAEVVDIVTAVAGALDFAHHGGLLHRDVKPANILVSDPQAGQRRILLADFGIARYTDDTGGLTATNMTVGSVNYAAPEQLVGDPSSASGDQYALAATTYHLLLGTPPFRNTNPAVVIGQHLNATPPPLSATRPDLAAADSVLSRGLAKRPGDRYPNCLAFAAALRAASTTTDAPDITSTSTTVVISPGAFGPAIPAAEHPTALIARPIPDAPPVFESRWGAASPEPPMPTRQSEPSINEMAPPGSDRSTNIGVMLVGAVVVLLGIIAAIVVSNAPETDPPYKTGTSSSTTTTYP